MDIDALRGKLDENEFAALGAYIAELVGKVEAARNESINGRKSLKAEAETLRVLRDRMFEKLGIADAEELETLPTVTGQAEAVKQLEAKIKRLEREVSDKAEAYVHLATQRRQDQQTLLLAKAMGSQEWADREIAEDYIGKRISWEDDQPYLKAEDGRLVNLEDGVKLIAQSKPTLLKSRGAGGSGYQHSSGGFTKNPWAKETFNLTEQGRIVTENPALAEQLMASAK